MTSESEQSILNSLEHLIFDEHKIISYKWITNHFKIQIENSKKILSKFVNQHTNKLFITHCITGYKQITIQHPNPYNSQYKSPTKQTKNNHNNNNNLTDDSNDDTSSTFTILIVSDSELKKTKSLFNKICSIHIHSISVKESAKIKDFYTILYQNDYQKQLTQVTNYLSQQTLNKNNNNNNDMKTYSNLMNAQVKTVASPQLHRALQKTQNKNKNIKPPIKKNTFNEKIAKLKKGTPLKHKFNKLEINEKKNETDSKSESPNSNANKKNKNNAQNSGIEACFAKAAVLNKNKPKKSENTSKKKKADNITNFFGVETNSKSKKKTKKRKKKKSKSKKNTKVSIKPAKKRKRKEMEENNLIPIVFDSESSECEENELNEYGISDDEELEGIKRNFKANRNNSKRRKIVDSEDENDDGDVGDVDDVDGSDSDEDIDLNDKKRQKQIEKDKLLNERKKNFFGKAKGNKMRKMKKQKKETRSYINDKGMFVTEDVWVTDDEDDGGDGGNGNGNVHVYQDVTNKVCDDDDIDMMDKENSNDVENGCTKKNGNGNGKNKKKKEKKVRKVVKHSKKGKKKSGKRDGNITNFFKAK